MLLAMLHVAILFLLPFLGTSLGSATVLFLKNALGEKTEKLNLGFASGVMIAALVWSLLLPAIETSTYFTVSVGFLFGIFFLLFLDVIIPHLHNKAKDAEGRKTGLSKSSLLILAVTLHNIPEGMAVGAVAAAMGLSGVSFASALALSIGMAIQNFPEGMIISFPLYEEGGANGKVKSFFYGVMSGVVEPIGSALMYLFAVRLTSILPLSLSFAAGAMFYVVVEELIPEASEGNHSNIGTVGAALGFTVMMILDGIFS